MERTRQRISSAAGLLAAAAIFAACAAPGGGSTTPPATAGAPASNPPASAPAGLALKVSQNDVLGAYASGKDGLSLYVFGKDRDGTSACVGDCAGSWPPLTVAKASDVTAGNGVTGGLGTITRDDGSLQVTLGGAPLYYFAGDSAAGDTKGQGLNGVWHLASPSGGPVDDAGASPAAGAPSPTICSGRYCY